MRKGKHMSDLGSHSAVSNAGKTPMMSQDHQPGDQATNTPMPAHVRPSKTAGKKKKKY